MQDCLDALRAGRIDFNAFARQTRPQWEALAGKLFRRYPLPRCVDPADLVQEMMIAAWGAVRSWNPTCGPTLKRYVTWTAYNQAKRWIHHERNAYRRSDHSPSRHEIVFADLTGPDQEESVLLDSLASASSTAESTAIAKEEFARIVYQLDDQTAAVIELWASAGNSADAADALMQDPQIVSALQLWTPGAAQRVVHRAIETSLRIAADT